MDLKRYDHRPGTCAALFGIEALAAGLRLFDTVLSMDVLYHRRSPIDHLLELRDCLRPGGEQVLETLIIVSNIAILFMIFSKKKKLSYEM